MCISIVLDLVLHLLIFRIQKSHLPDVVVYDVGLIEFRSDVVNLRAKTTFLLLDIFRNGCGKQRLTIFPPDDENYLSELSEALFIDYSEQSGDESLLP